MYLVPLGQSEEDYIKAFRGHIWMLINTVHFAFPSESQSPPQVTIKMCQGQTRRSQPRWHPHGPSMAHGGHFMRSLRTTADGSGMDRVWKNHTKRAPLEAPATVRSKKLKGIKLRKS